MQKQCHVKTYKFELELFLSKRGFGRGRRRRFGIVVLPTKTQNICHFQQISYNKKMND